MFRYYLLMGIKSVFKVTETQPAVSQTNNFPSKYQKSHAKGLPVGADKIKYPGIFLLL